jgi:ATP-dependent Lon protease
VRSRSRASCCPSAASAKRRSPARRHGIHTFILPALNLPDLDELPEGLKKDLTFVPVETIEEVLRVAFAHAEQPAR